MLTKCLILCKFKMRHDDHIDTCAFLIVKVDRFRILYTTIGINKILTIIILRVYLLIVPNITCLYRYFVKLRDYRSLQLIIKYMIIIYSVIRQVCSPSPHFPFNNKFYQIMIL